MNRYCGSPSHHLTRRAFLGNATGAMIGGTAGLKMLGTPLFAEQLKREQKQCILIFLAGGASQLETWDPKPGTSTGGPFQTIPTSIPGYHVCELLPKMAERLSQHTAVVRSLDTTNTDHDAGARVLLRGNRPDDSVTDYPTLGSVLAHELEQRDARVPNHVALYTAYVGLTLNRVPDAAGFLGSRYDPINILSRLSPDGLQPPKSISDFEHRQRSELRSLLAQQFVRGRQRDGTLASYNDAYQRVRGIMASDQLFDISKEPQNVRDRYGPTLFGQQALVGRRLIEAGVPFVRLNRGWWDSHGENFETHLELVPELDHVMAVLMDDLQERGLLENTLVVTFSEMGRTPAINVMRGRDHWGAAWSATLSGLGVKPGAVYGATNDNGTEVIDGKVDVAKFYATIFQALGIDHQKEFKASDGRPVVLTDYGTEPIREILA